MINYRRIFLKALATALIALILTLLISSIFVPLLGGELAGAGLVMTIVCPLVTAVPVSALHYLNSERLRIARNEALVAHEELAVAYKELRKLSRTDYLTTTLNRQAFFDRMTAISETGIAGGLLFIDLDHFKLINDTCGHATGDAALRRVGILLSRLTEHTGFVGRLGGEEFGVFVENPDLEHITAFAENVRQEINALRISADNNRKVVLSASIGVTLCYPGFRVEDALLEADEKMYLAKDSGRNLIVS